MNKTFKKLTVLSMVGLMCLGVSGCSKDEQEIGNSKTEITNNLTEDLGESFDKDDKKELTSLLNNINNDAYDIVNKKNIKELKDDDYLDFAKKYAIWDNDSYLSKKYISSIYNIVDGYDGDFSNNLKKWNNVSLMNRIQYEGNMPIDALEQMRPNKDFSSLTTKKMSELKDTDGIVNFIGYSKWLVGEGCIGEDWIKNVKEYMLETYPDMDYARVFTVTLKFDFENTYPENDIELKNDGTASVQSEEELNKILSYPSNTLDILLVDTNDGWKIVDCKWLYSTRNVVNE